MMVDQDTDVVEEKKVSPEGVADETVQGTEEGEKRQRTPLDVIPEVMWLLTQSPQHKFMFLADLEWYFLPPLRHRQFRVFHKDKAPIAFVSWAYVSDEVEERLKSGATRLKPEDWRSGENLWLIDLCVPFGGGESVLRELRENVFKDQKVKSLQSAPGGRGMAMVEW